jgi:hypothetical protein
MPSMIPLDELLLNLKLLDEVTLIEILQLHSDEIVDKFQDVIEERYEELQFKVEDPIQREPREEERYEPLTGELTWPQAPPNWDEYDEGSFGGDTEL